MNSNLTDVEIISALRSKGFKATSQRIAICRSILHSADHPTPQRIYEEVKKFHPTVSLATVYNTLGVLEELNLLQNLPLKHVETRLDPNMKPHLNMVCSRCGVVRDVADEYLKEMIKKAAEKVRFSISGQCFLLYGMCESCRKKR
jgi:Fur family peroxide stress response transcriptional regulator